jgi:tetratricopeptide (TPR) repeat protein
MTTTDAINLAMRRLTEGKLDEAERLCESVTAQDPSSAAVWNLLAMIALRRGNDELAAQHIERAITLEPKAAALYANLGELKKKMGRMDESLTAFNKAVELEPASAIMRNKLGIALRLNGRLEDAVSEFDRAITADAGYADPHNNRGNALRDLGRFNEAMEAYRRAIALKPNLAPAHANLGNVLGDLGRFALALGEYQIALQLQPRYPEALLGRASALRQLKRFDEALDDCKKAIELGAVGDGENILGSIFYDLRRFDEAIAAFRRSIELDHSSAIKRNNLAMALDAVGDVEEAIAAASAAVNLKPNYAEGFNTLGTIHADQGQYDAAAAAFERAIRLFPDYALAHWNLSLILLLRGDYPGGWAEHEWRKGTAVESRPRDFSQPRWEGGYLAGKTILLHHEQGFGDMLQFVRYAPLVAERGGRVIVSTAPDLTRLLREMPQISQVVDAGNLPEFDCHCPILSLPFAFKTQLDSIPADIPYLKAPAEAAARWREILPVKKDRLRIGLVWAGNPGRKLDQRRSLQPEQLAPLFEVGGAEFFSLQKGNPVSMISSFPQVNDPSGKLTDFAETAAAVENLDLVITVDTAVAHLAGALGKPVWVLLGFVPAWRWMLDRADSPWYSTMRLFRQPAMGDWNTPMEQVVLSLREIIGR